MKKNFRQKFLENCDDTGRHIVYSIRTGKSYCVEPIADGRGVEWGSYNPGTGNIEHKKGDGKYRGAVREKDSLITSKNGFKPEHIHIVDNGSPYSIIDDIDAKYPNKSI